MPIFNYIPYRKATDCNASHDTAPDINFSLQQGCSNFALQICNKFVTSRNLSQACGVKFIANYSKTRVRTQPRIQTRDISIPKPVILIIQPARL
ncbi:hypothetical protein AVEN_209449-1 [Araneus ventricosus]|uniref:Uncharacterized protein n=1 Tax=Araneus ventricosus TaxID=182803 RepID=A0A4Y2NJ10_ARAVE|nr:hypothetical protein AVEN_209449-1 [Araneus ventricosus]